MVFTDHVLDGVPSASHRRCPFPFVRVQLPAQSSVSFVASLDKVLHFLDCLAHVFLPRFEPQRSVTNKDDNLHFVVTIPIFSESLIPFCAALIHTAMKPASSAGVPGDSWSKDDFGLNGSGCATPSHSTHLDVPFFLIACIGATESKHFFRSSLAPTKHLLFILARSMPSISLECTSAACLLLSPPTISSGAQSPINSASFLTRIVIPALHAAASTLSSPVPPSVFGDAHHPDLFPNCWQLRLFQTQFPNYCQSFNESSWRRVPVIWQPPVKFSPSARRVFDNGLELTRRNRDVVLRHLLLHVEVIHEFVELIDLRDWPRASQIFANVVRNSLTFCPPLRAGASLSPRPPHQPVSPTS